MARGGFGHFCVVSNVSNMIKTGVPKPDTYKKVWGFIDFQTLCLRKFVYEEEIIIWVEKCKDGDVKFILDQSVEPKSFHEDGNGVLFIRKNKLNEVLEQKNYKTTFSKKCYDKCFETIIDEKELYNGHHNKVIRRKRKVKIEIEGHTLNLEHCHDIYLPDAVLDDYELLEKVCDHKELFVIKRKNLDVTHFLKVNAFGGQKKADRILNEIKILERARDHNNIIKMITVDTHPKSPYIILQYAPGGTLCDFMYSNGTTEEDAKIVFKQVLAGITYLHRRRIAHRDIKPENIVLMTGTLNYVKIIDFNKSCRLPEDGSKLSEVSGTPYFSSPQIMRIELEKEGETEYTEKCDIWSFGVTLFDFLVGAFPFDDSSKDAYYEDIMSVNWESWTKRNRRFLGLTCGTQKLIIKCFRVEEESRPNAKKLCNCPWFD